MVYLYSILIFLAIIALVAIVVYVRFFKKKHTRERFAFVALITVGVLIANAIAIIAGGSFFTEFLRAVSNQFLGTTMPEPIGASEKLMIISLILMMIFMVYFLYRNWTGNISTREAKAKELGNYKFNLITDALVIISGEKLEISDKKADDNRREVFPEVNTKRFPWHIRAAQLLKLSDLQYDIDLGDYDVNTRGMLMSDDNEFQQKYIGKDWYASYKSYLAKYADTPTLIFCSEKIPHQGEIDRVANSTEFAGKFQKLIIAVESEDRLADIRLKGCEIEFVNQEKLLRKLVSFKDYCAAIEREFDRPLEGSDRSLNDIYVPLNAYHYMHTPESTRLERGEDIRNVEQYVLDWAQDENHSKQHLAIVGEYGQGKSVLSLKIAKEMLAKPDQYRRIPIIIELRGASPRTLDIWGVLGKFANPYGLNAQALYQLHRAGKLLIILEGFDEMDLVGDTEMLLAHFQQLWQLAREPQAKIIITGRPNLFTDDPQRRQALGIHRHRAHLPYTQAVHLEKMSDTQIRQALRNTTSDVREGILKALADSPDQSSFAELVTRPSTLYQLSTVWGDEIGKDTRRLNAAAVIGKFIQNDYNRQSAKPVEMPLTADERSYFIMGIAVAMMMENDYTNQIKKADLRDVVQKLLDNFPEIQPYRDAVKGKKRGYLLRRLQESEYDFETVFKDVIAGGILVTDLSGSGTFRFTHKSYLEYLISDFYVNAILNDKEREYDFKIANAISKTLNFKDNQLEQSVDVDNFIAQLIAIRIHLKNEKTGMQISVKGNEALYSKAIFNKLIPSWWEQNFPNLMFWLRLHESLISLHTIALLVMVLGITYYYWFESEYWTWITIGAQTSWYLGLLYYFNLLKIYTEIEVAPSLYTKRLKLWQYTMKDMQIKIANPTISKQIKTILYSDTDKYSEIVLLNIVTQFALFGSVLLASLTVNIGIKAVIFPTIFWVVLLISFARNISVSDIDVNLLLKGDVSAYKETETARNQRFSIMGGSPIVFAALLGVIGAIIGILIGFVVGSVTGTGAVKGGITGFRTGAAISAPLGIIFGIWLEHENYKEALKAEQIRQAEAEQPDA